LQAHLLPFAVRLGERLLQTHTLSAQTRRWMAQRFAPSSEGAELAARLWPELLKANALDADGWTLFAEALRHVGRTAEAEIADGFGAALSGGGAPTSLLPVRPIARAAAAEWSTERPQELMSITSHSMPRLYSAIAPQLQALGAGEVRPYLSLRGGVE